MTNIKSKINPYSKIYNNFNKFITSLSCVCFVIAIIIPGGEHMNIPLVIIMITSFLHHFQINIYILTINYIYYLKKLTILQY